MIAVGAAIAATMIAVGDHTITFREAKIITPDEVRLITLNLKTFGFSEL